MMSIHDTALSILGPSEAIRKLQEETGELHFAVQRYAQGKGDAIEVIKEFADVCFVIMRVYMIGTFVKALGKWDREEHNRNAAKKLTKAMNDKLIIWRMHGYE